MDGVAQHLATVLISGGALLLLWAGVLRLRATPGATQTRRRLSGGLELGLGVSILLGPGRLGATLLAGAFALFTAIHLASLRRGDAGSAESCDCFDAAEVISPGRAAVLTGALALLAGLIATLGAPSLRQLAAADPATLAWTPSAALALAVAWRVAFSGTAVLTAMSRLGGTWLAATPARSPQSPGGDAGIPAGVTLGVPRRSFLISVAVIGSALVAVPMRFLLYPGTALGAIVGPGDCVGGDCLDGYTAFCCEITQGQSNTCPTGTFPGGWWMCTDYSGRQLCSEEGVRYYVDCNALPGVEFPGGCRCANDNCNERRIACNIFRYGQCNTQIEGVTAVVCRMVTCENPATISELHCSASLAVDDSVCGHDVPCLEPQALELAGAGGV